MPFTLHGIPVSQGIAIGRAYLIQSAVLDINRYLVEPKYVETEIARFVAAQQAIYNELVMLRSELQADTLSEIGAFLDVQILILGDEMLVEAVIKCIRVRKLNAEWALTEQLKILDKHFDGINDGYLRERKADLAQVVDRVLKELTGLSTVSVIADGMRCDTDEMIIVAHDIAPADMLKFKMQRSLGFVTDLGGCTSHTAIVARSLGIPAAVGMQQASVLIQQNDMIIVDGDRGVVIVDPTPLILEEYTSRQSKKWFTQYQLQSLKLLPTLTVCGTKIDLLANIEMPDDARAALDAGAVGIGLFRTEFLFMNPRGEFPQEEQQFNSYRRVVQTMNGWPVTIRTIDVGADKLIGSTDRRTIEPDSALGLRAIRWSLSKPQIFLSQLRPILRASAFGPVRILVPMLSHAFEIDQTLDLIEKAKKQLDDAGLAFDPNIQVGAMIEIPAAVIALPMFLERLDFLSIGTNDLIQYTLAIDRTDNSVAHLYDPLHPAVLRLISMTLRETQRAGVPISVCGEMAGDPALTRLLLGMGLTEFSMHPSQLLLVKQEVLRVQLESLKNPVEEALASYEPEKIQAAIDRLLKA
ncbi:phosphoenolpyruvate--protein phosphotransferase [Candidatus Vallotia tarda]|uniref:Phosphoenolpyruvate-protein phosphotransferase n=1 Tax=Candidatus Vallotiella hemipterorum TaxID=1177213 RepID=A0A916NF33_9BURK|nr:phosphoenolpyruvate--protein phosphotransferase [Candidatus Vallotia tarda]CAG7596218.1 Phosphoenolpyruvate-protein phosphotransferase [Candidatus Vallotia tarda]